MQGGGPASKAEALDRLRELAGHLRAYGASEEEIEHALISGEPQRALLDTVVRRSSEGRTVSPAEIEARGGHPVAALGALLEAFGLAVTDPHERAFTPEEADALVTLWELRETWPLERRHPARARLRSTAGPDRSQLGAAVGERARARPPRASG